jgi:Flp pilus assembly protein CpaB
MKIAPGIRIALTLVGILVVVIAFLGVMYVGMLNNPPPLHIAVALRDIASGERLGQGDYQIMDQVLDPRLGTLYVQEAEVASFVGVVVVDNIRRGDPLNKARFMRTGDGTSGALSRYGLALTDTSQVIMVLPVKPEFIPSKVKNGDHVNILFAAGDGGLARLPESTPPAVGLAMTGPPIIPGSEAATNLLMTMTVGLSNTRPAIVLPLADVLLEHIEVLDVQYEQVQNQNYSPDSPQVYVNGPINAIVVRVPKTYQTILTFASVMGKVRFAISSPLMTTQDRSPQPGVDWGKIVALYRWKEDVAIARGETLTQTLFPNYAGNLEGAR